MFYPKNPIITGNVIYATSFGITLGRCDGAVIVNNKITADYMGVSLLGARSIICNNKISGNFWAGIYIDSVWNTENDYYSSSNLVLSNTVIGASIPSSIGIFLVEYTSRNLVAANRVTDVETSILDKGTNLVTGNR